MMKWEIRERNKYREKGVPQQGIDCIILSEIKSIYRVIIELRKNGFHNKADELTKEYGIDEMSINAEFLESSNEYCMNKYTTVSYLFH